VRRSGENDSSFSYGAALLTLLTLLTLSLPRCLSMKHERCVRVSGFADFSLGVVTTCDLFCLCVKCCRLQRPPHRNKEF
jgi:hypothetical protein